MVQVSERTGAIATIPSERRPPDARPTQAERRSTSEERIARAARRLFARQGYIRTTLAQIGQEAGYSGALVSHRFGSKLRLFEQVVWSTMHDLFEAIGPEIEGRSGVDTLCAETEALIDLIKRGSDLLRSLQVVSGESIGTVPEIRPVIHEVAMRYRGRIQRVIEEGISEGTIRPDVDPVNQAVMIHLMVVGLGMVTLKEAPKVDLDALREGLCAGLRRNLAVDESPHSTA